MQLEDRIAALQRAYPLPQARPDFEPFEWCLSVRGKELIKEIIIRENITLMLEIGVFFGGSAKEWLKTSPDLKLIGIDPFPSMANYFAKKADLYHDRINYGNLDRESLLQQLQREDATYLSALSNIWQYKERFIPIRGTAPERLYDLYEIGITPELIYIDSNCKLEELDTCYELFPDSIISGYNWTWRSHGKYPLQQPLEEFASHHGYEIVTSQSTWLLQKPQPQFFTVSDSSIIQKRNGLSRITQKLQQQPCKIAYLGASVTAQKQGYRPFLHQWFQDYFHQPHIEINAGTGGISSTAAVFLMDEDVIQHQPDLCFIEYSTGDMTWSSLDVALVIEAMVRKLQAIGCEICFLYLYRNDRNFDASNPTLIEYEKIAEHHGIPSINAGRYVEELISLGKIVFEDLYRDHVHNTVEGGEFIAAYLANALKDFLDSQSHFSLPGEDKSQLQYLYADTYAQGKIIDITPSMFLDPNDYTTGTFAQRGKEYHYLQIDTSNEIRFTIKGVLASITSIVGRESGIVELITPQRSWFFNFWDTYCHYDRFNAKMINITFNDYTPVRIRLTDQEVDYSVCRRKMEDTDKIVQNLRVMKLFVCGELLPF
ncbi:MAG: hypothetical protein Tsb0014_12560 [Pleurocapsa sp.]